MIDLHVHTNCSDGTDSPIEVLKKAEKLGLTHISITDHNNVDAYFQIGDYKKYYSGTLIFGVEPECHYRRRIIELLGYNIDVKKMRELLKGKYLTREELNKSQIEIVYEKLINAGFKLSADVLETVKTTKHYYSTCHFHEDFKKYPENRKLVPDNESWESSIAFFRNYFSNRKSPLYMNITKFYPSVGTIFKFIKQAGGLVFIPHVFVYGEKARPFLRDLVKRFDIDGIECFYPSHTEKQTKFLLKFCEENNLLISGGSDFHGAHRTIRLGSKLPMQHWLSHTSKPPSRAAAFISRGA